MRLVLDIAGDKQVERELLRVAGDVGDVSPALNRIVDLWIDETGQQFDTQGFHGSGGWAPLTPGYAAEKAKRFPGRGILHRTFALQQSLTDRGDPNMIVQIGRDELAWGTKVPYATFHQLGTRRMPRRRPVELTERARQQTVRILQRFIITGEVEA